MSRTFQRIIVIIAYKLTVVTVFLKIFSKCIPISKMCQNIINTFSEERCFMKVAVFRQYDSKPMYLAEDLPLDSLPKYDKAMLDAGIKIYSDEDLRKLLEDYDS